MTTYSVPSDPVARGPLATSPGVKMSQTAPKSRVSGGGGGFWPVPGGMNTIVLQQNARTPKVAPLGLTEGVARAGTKKPSASTGGLFWASFL
jgi:hypothetical protein